MDASQLFPIISGALIVIYVVVEVIIKLFSNLDFFKKRKKEKEKHLLEEERKHIIKVFDEIYNSKVDNTLKEINKTLNYSIEKQDKINKNIIHNIELLTNSSNDILRREIVKIYYKFLPYKKITRFDKETCSKMAKDYFGQNGNSFIKDIYDEIKTWDVVESYEDLK